MLKPGNRVTLLTDFGTQDAYVGIMKGVIACFAPQAHVVDLCHAVAPQDIAGAAFQLAAAWKFFPRGTVHVVVVDPGVGTDRAILAVQAGGFFFLVPDNGVIAPVLSAAPSVDKIIRVENDAFFLKPVSNTFHGRDIFAPMAAHIINGHPLESFGPAVQDYDTSGFPAPVESRLSDHGREIEGEIVHVDHFGNLISNIPVSPGTSVVRVTCGDVELTTLQNTYAEGAPGALIALVGSSGYLELAVNKSRAADYPGLGRGKKIYVRYGPDPTK